LKRRRLFLDQFIWLALELFEIWIIAREIFIIWRRFNLVLRLSAIILSLFRIINVFTFNSHKRRFIFIVQIICIWCIRLFNEKLFILFFRKEKLAFLNLMIFQILIFFFSFTNLVLQRLNVNFILNILLLKLINLSSQNVFNCFELVDVFNDFVNIFFSNIFDFIRFWIGRLILIWRIRLNLLIQVMNKLISLIITHLNWIKHFLNYTEKAFFNVNFLIALQTIFWNKTIFWKRWDQHLPQNFF